MKRTSPIPVTAVFDIGKTNKKFFLLDENYAIIKKQQTTMEQITDDDGDPCEDLEQLEDWLKHKLKDAAHDQHVKIKALNFSTYGASFVHLDEAGNVASPLYNYLKPHSKDLFRKFYDTYGGKKELALQTASPMMGMLNSGFQLYWLKHTGRLKLYDITHSLHFPQYLSYLITGKRSSEITSIGCHTGLWDFPKNKYHHWLSEEKLDHLLAPIQPVSVTQTAKYDGLTTKVGPGIHDSSAALAPYLLALEDPFMLISTGTWSITFNPFNDEPLTYPELEKDCLCYLDINGNQVKSSRFFLGDEYSYQRRKITRHFDRQKLQSNLKLDIDLLNTLIRENEHEKKLQLEHAHNSGPFPEDEPGDWPVEEFSSYKEAYHQLMLDLVSIQVESIKLAQGSKPVDRLIITGGFSQNDFFVKLLASFFPEKNVYTSPLSNASALGAAMVINNMEAYRDQKAELKELLELKLHPPIEKLNAKEYSWKNSVIT